MAGSTFQPPIHLDPSQEPGQQTAFINQNFQSLASSLNPFIVSDGATNRIILGKQNDGTYGLRVSKSGVDVGTATNSQLIFNSEQDIFKIVQTGTVTTVISSLAGGATNTTTVAHNLNFSPAFVAFVTLPNNWISVIGTPGLTALPTYALAADGAGAAHILEVDLARVDSTNIYFDVINTTTALHTGPYTYVFKYYLLQETAS